VYGLPNSIVFNDKLVLLEAVEHVAVLGLNGGGDQDDIGLGFEGVALVAGWRRVLRGSDGGARQNGEEKSPHRHKSNRRGFWGGNAGKNIPAKSAVLQGDFAILGCFGDGKSW
jgi:hypothetical protein